MPCVMPCLLGPCWWRRVPAPSPSTLCHVTPAAPVVDGTLDDACWRQASAPPQLYELGVGGKAAPNSTSVRLLMDEQALYVGVASRHRPGRPAQRQTQASMTPSAWGDDCIELMLAPSFVSQTTTT